MARLIDADALILHFNEWALSASPTGRESVKESTLKVKEYDTIETAIEGIAHAPTVPAIPVEWLKRVQRECVADIQQVPMYVAIGWLVDMWQKEQEAQDDRKLD